MKFPEIKFVKLMVTTLLVLMTSVSFAQTYNNEWIDFSQTYYKFKVGRDGVFRIMRSTLATVGLDNVDARDFKLVRNGQEIPLYTTSASGPLATNGYIEFWGEMNDGKPDRALYRSAAYQHSDRYSLETDSSTYFLTKRVGTNLRLNDVVNDVALGSSTLPVEPYFTYTYDFTFRERLNPGIAAVVQEYVYSSSYDKGEFLSSREIYSDTPSYNASYKITAANLFVDAGGGPSKFKFGAFGNALNVREVTVKMNGTDIVTGTAGLMDYFNDMVREVNVSTSLLSSNNANLEFHNQSPVKSDRMVISFFQLTYPRDFNFGGANNFSFELPAKPSGYYLEIDNFSYGSAAPVLYDYVYGQRYVGNIATPGKVKFYLPGSTSVRKLRLVNQEAFTIGLINSLTSKTFIDFTNAARQGDYLIITSPQLYIGSNGNNPIQDYKIYRSSISGGSFNVAVYETQELIDQFAFGIKSHPSAVKNFLSFARAKFPTPIKNVLLIGKGVNYTESRAYEYSPMLEKLNLIPPFGYPGSDNMLGSANTTNPISELPIGRLSVVKGVEVENYLEKVKEYETVQRTAPNTIAGKLWMKNTMEVTGSSDQYLGTQLCSYMEAYKLVVMDSLAGMNVNVFCKNSVATSDQFSSDRIAQLFEEGISMLTYFGHSSSTTLEFNIDNPENYNNPGKYPIFSVNGCNAGDFFKFDPERFGLSETLSEKFTLAKQRGGIAFIASTHFGIVNYLNIYINALFTNISTRKYNTTVGDLCRTSLQDMVNAVGPSDFYARLHAEEITLHGDPALKTNSQAKPDYIIEEAQVKVSPTFISVSANKFDVAVKMYNMGKAVSDSITVEVKRQYPDGTIVSLAKKKIRGIYYSDSINLVVPVVANRDKGLNKLIVTLDTDNIVDEIAEYNNTVTKEFFIYEDEAKPIYPYNYSIVNNTAQKLYASTANPLSSQKNYVLEIDTTELFNSPLKKQKQIASIGGLLEFDNQMAFQDSTVYYWRVSMVPAAGGDYRWNTSSFIYLKNSSTGSNQSHFFQHEKSEVNRIKIDNDRDWKFGNIRNSLYIRNTMYPTGGTEANQFMVIVNGEDLFISACLGRSILFNVINPMTFKPWKNVDENGVSLNASGSASNCLSGRSYNFEFSYLDEIERKKIMNFMDSIPDGYFVIARSFDYSVPLSYSATWRGDTTFYGHDNSVYHRLLNAGFSKIDSINSPRAWSFVYKKNDPSFQPKFDYTEGIYDQSLVLADCLTNDTAGFVTSPLFGPAKSWTNLHWRGKSKEAISTDRVSIDVIGVNALGNETLLSQLDANTQDFDLSTVSASQFPFMKLKMSAVDSINYTPYQLRYWRINYEPVPEGALAPNVYFESKDSLEVGEDLKFGISFKNISPTQFDSLKLKFVIIDKDNVPHDIPFARQKPLVSGDTVTFKYTIDTKLYPGANTIYLDYNPEGDQPEQEHFNNFLYKSFYVKSDLVNPLLDVTFDGVHILNRDIVSSKPHIQIKLKDEAKFLLLNDTSLITTLQVRYPDQNQTTRTYKFGTDTLRFIPAQSGADNTAIIDFTPYFPTLTDQNNQPLNPEGDEYELFVRGKDKSGNRAGDIDYHVSFRVIDKPMISNLLNYPNPFTTSTAFVFTITGSEIPENIKIQILTVTGKIVREITKDELGPLHIGRNITEYKWDGNDQYGQRLANGVYLYRVVTTLKGSRMQKFTDKGDDTDRYFNKGYGKMYLMR